MITIAIIDSGLIDLIAFALIMLSLAVGLS
jgi:hypothetical protein